MNCYCRPTIRKFSPGKRYTLNFSIALITINLPSGAIDVIIISLKFVRLVWCQINIFFPEIFTSNSVVNIMSPNLPPGAIC